MITRWMLALMSTATGTFAATANAEPSDPGKPGEFITYYYLYKNEADVPKFLKALQSSKMLDEHAGAKAPLSAFLSVIFAEHHERVEKWVRSARPKGEVKDAVMKALWMAGQAELIEEVFGKTPEFAKEECVSLLKRPLREPGDLDMMWGAFSASGDAAYVSRVIDVLDEKTELSGDDQMDGATRKSAAWSLRSNMMQYELVHRCIKKEAKSRKGAVRRALRAMLTSVSTPSFPDKDEDFSAMLLAIDREALEEFEKPVDEAPRVKHVSVAHRGDIVALKLIYTGIELTEELNADVRYDLKFLDPDGKPYCETDLKNQEGTVRKVPTRFRVFDNEQVIMIRFEAKDKLGKYKIVATIYDKVGKRKIALENEIELKE